MPKNKKRQTNKIQVEPRESTAQIDQESTNIYDTVAVPVLNQPQNESDKESSPQTDIQTLHQEQSSSIPVIQQSSIPVIQQSSIPVIQQSSIPVIQQPALPERKKCPLSAFHPYEGYECLTCRQLNGEDISKYLVDEKENHKKDRKKEKKETPIITPKSDKPYQFQVGVDGLKAREDFVPSWMKSTLKKK